jgi:hypothetical protein
MTMTRARVRVLLVAGWVITNTLLIVFAGVPPGLATIGNIAGGFVIAMYVRALPEAPLTRAERILQIGAKVVLATIAALFALLLVVTMLAFLVAWMAT